MSNFTESVVNDSFGFDNYTSARLTFTEQMCSAFSGMSETNKNLVIVFTFSTIVSLIGCLYRAYSKFGCNCCDCCLMCLESRKWNKTEKVVTVTVGCQTEDVVYMEGPKKLQPSAPAMMDDICVCEENDWLKENARCWAREKDRYLDEKLPRVAPLLRYQDRMYPNLELFV